MLIIVAVSLPALSEIYSMLDRFAVDEVGVGFIETLFSDLTLPCCFSIESLRGCMGDVGCSGIRLEE